MDGLSKTPEPDAFLAVLEGIARDAGAYGVALYEVGYTFPGPRGLGTSDPDWTKLLYLVGGWPLPAAPGRDGELQGLPATLPIGEATPLLEMVDGKRQHDLLAQGVVPVLFGSSFVAASDAQAIVAARASSPREVPSILFLFFRTIRAAANHIGQLSRDTDRREWGAESGTGSRASDDTPRRLAALRDTLKSDATVRRFDFLAKFYSDIGEALGKGGISDQRQHFDEVIDRNIQALSDQLRCPNIQVYILSDIYGMEDADRPNSNRPPRQKAPNFVLRWPSSAKLHNAKVLASEGGPIGLVLESGAGFSVHNLHAIANDESTFKVKTKYKELRNLTSYGVDANGYAVALTPEPFEVQPPSGPATSLMAHPILVGRKVVGAIVCDGRQGPPYVFHEWDEQLLDIVALTLGTTWANIEYRYWAELDQKLRVRAARRISRFSSRVGAKVRSVDVTDDDIYKEMLIIADQIVDLPKPFSSIKKYYPELQEFRFSEHRNGDVWDNREVRLTADTLKIPAKTGKIREPKYATEYVFRSQIPVLVEVARAPPQFTDSFPGHFRYAVYAPIFKGSDRGKIVAVLDVRKIVGEQFPPGIVDVLAELCEIAGLLLALAEERRDAWARTVELRQTHEQLKRTSEAQIGTFEDLKHQLQSPHRNALQQINDLIETIDANEPIDELRTELVAARGHLLQAFRVGDSAGLLAELARHDRITNVGLEPIKRAAFRELVLRQADNHQSVIDRSYRIEIRPDAASLSAFREDDIKGNINLLEQVISNLFENAAKYSLDDTKIYVKASRTSQDRLVLEFKNYGRTIHWNERHEITKRNIRGREASTSRAAGRGIGLWLVDRIMKSFGGDLEIIIGSGRAEPHVFRLLFPIRG